MINTLEVYLNLSKRLHALDLDSPGADELRDEMDDIWYKLNNDERQLLNDIYWTKMRDPQDP